MRARQAGLAARAVPSWRTQADLAGLGVALAAGPPARVGMMLRFAAADLLRRQAGEGYDLVLAAFPERGTARDGAIRCGTVTQALDHIMASKVVVRAGGVPAGRARLTVLVSLVAPAPAELRILVDLAADPGGITALLPAPARFPGGAAAAVPPGSQAPPVPAAVAAPPAAAAPSAAAAASSAAVAAPPAAVASAPAPAPALRIGVLGTLTVNDQPGALVPAQSQLIVALALSGHGGLSNRRLCERLGADPDHPRPTDSLRQLIVRTRRQLGRAGDGREWIEHLGHGVYALHPAATVDLAEFDALTETGLKARDADALTGALAKVRGRPFTGCYYWWLDLTQIEPVTERIVRAATTLAEIELDGGRPAEAARAARAGLSADPSAEQLWRLLMRAEHAAGNLAGVREAWGRCQVAIAEIAADGLPDSATAAVYADLLAR